MSDTKTIHLALQGGGAHGAFTWGVLDALLMDGRLRFAGISGTSAGAINAVALAHGWGTALADKRDPAEGARAALARVWSAVMDLGSVSEGTAQFARLMMGALPGAMTRWSPYQANPLDYNPLRKLIEREIDFERLARLRSPRVFVAATDVETGRATIFSGRRLTAQAVMASACLPQLFQAPEIDGKTYWDGGYSANPAIGPLLEMGETSDVLLVQINPVRSSAKAMTAAEIADRANDLTFNASLIAQMRTIGLINDLVARGLGGEGVKAVYMHRIDGGQVMAELPLASKLTPRRSTMEKLFELGQANGQRWLRRHFDAVGEKGTVNLRRDYGDPLKLQFEPGPEEPADADESTPGDFGVSRLLWSPDEDGEPAGPGAGAGGGVSPAGAAPQPPASGQPES